MNGLKSLRPFGVTAHLDGTKLVVDHGEPLTRWDLRDMTGQTVASVYGVVLQHWHGPDVCVSEDAIVSRTQIATTDDFERILPQIHGSFLVETHAPLPHRLYPDIGCTIPVVYCAASRRFGASAGTMFDDTEYDARFLSERYDRLVGNQITGSWIPAFLTAHSGLSRLLPNFYLDLSDWTVSRFWPRPDDLETSLDLDIATITVSDNVRGYTEAVARQFGTVACTLTAGFDTRLLLCACRTLPRERLSFVTIGTPGAGLDQLMANRLTTSLGLTGRCVPVVRASQTEMETWDRLVGHCVNEASRELHPSLRAVDADVMFTGVYGETGRAHFYKNELDTIDGVRLTAGALAGRLSLPAGDPDILATLEEWLATIDWAPTSKILDLAYEELRFGSWAMAQAPVQRAIQFTLMPMTQRAVQSAFINTPPPVKTGKRLFDSVCRRLWPDAMAFGINVYGDWRDRTRILGKLVSRDHLTRGWRKMVARIRPSRT